MLRPIPLLLVVLFVAVGCRDEVDEHVDRITTLVKERDLAGLADLTAADDPDLRCRAARALVWVRGEDAAEQHRQMLGYEGCGWEVRAEAAWRLAEAGVTAAVPAIVAQLEDDKPEIRWNMARVLGLLGDRSALDALQSCDDDDDPFVAAWCEWAVCRIRGGGDCQEPNMDLTEGQTGP